MIEIRCKACSRLLARVTTFEGAIKCKSCKTLNRRSIVSQKSFYKRYLRKEKNNGD